MSDFFYPAQRVVYEAYPQEGEHLRIVRLRRDLATMLDVDRYIDPLKTSCDAFAYTDKGVHLFWVSPNTPTNEERESLPDALHVELTGQDDYPLICQSKAQTIIRNTDTGRLAVSSPRQCSAVTHAGFALAAEYNKHASAYVQQDMRFAHLAALIRILDRMRANGETDEQLRAACRAKEAR